MSGTASHDTLAPQKRLAQSDPSPWGQHCIAELERWVPAHVERGRLAALVLWIGWVALPIWQGLAKSSDTGWSGHAFDAVLITGSSIENGTQDYRRGATTKESLRLLCAPHATSRRCNAWRRATAGSAASTCSRSSSMNGMSVQTGGGAHISAAFGGAEECWTPSTTQAKPTAAQAHDLLPDFY